jgi:hypothetical protein
MSERVAPFAICSRDSEPLIVSFEEPGYEWLCMVCGNRYAYFGPAAASGTPELQERYEVLLERFKAGERPLSRTVPLGKASGPLRDLLIMLDETHKGHKRRPTCDAETTLADWEESGLWKWVG